MTRFLVSVAILIAWTAAPLAAGSSDSTPPSKQCANDKDNDGKEQAPNCADSDAEARRLFTSLQQAFLNLRRGTPGQLPVPIDDIGALASTQEQVMLEHALSCSVVGDADTVRKGVADFIARTQADEVIVTAMIHDHAARLRSFEILAETAIA